MAQPKARWPSSCHQGVSRVSVELSLAEMLRKQQSEACLYHHQEVSKKWAEYFFHGKCAFVLTLQHPRLCYAREFQFSAQLFKGRFIITLNPGFFLFFSKAFSRTIFSDIHRTSNHQLIDKKN